MRNLMLVVLLLFPLVLMGCAASEKNISVSSDVYKPNELSDWQVTLYPKDSNKRYDKFDFYSTNISYKGDTPATNVSFGFFGNYMSHSKEIAKNDDVTIGSTFNSGIKQIQVTVSWTEKNQNFTKSLTLNTGQ